MALNISQKTTLANSLQSWLQVASKDPVNGRGTFILDLMTEEKQEELFDKILDDEQKAIDANIEAWNKRKQQLPTRSRVAAVPKRKRN